MANVKFCAILRAGDRSQLFLSKKSEGPAINGLPTALARQELQNVPWISNLHESFHFQSQHPDSPLVRARQGEHSF